MANRHEKSKMKFCSPSHVKFSNPRHPRPPLPLPVAPVLHIISTLEIKMRICLMLKTGTGICLILVESPSPCPTTRPLLLTRSPLGIHSLPTTHSSPPARHLLETHSLCSTSPPPLAHHLLGTRPLCPISPPPSTRHPPGTHPLCPTNPPLPPSVDPPSPGNSSSPLNQSLPSAVIKRVQATLALLTLQQLWALEACLWTILPDLIAQKVGSQCHQLAENLNVQISAIQHHILGPTEDQDTLMQQPHSSKENQNGGNPNDGDDEDDDERGPACQMAKARKGPIVLTVSVAFPHPMMY